MNYLKSAVFVNLLTVPEKCRLYSALLMLKYPGMTRSEALKKARDDSETRDLTYSLYELINYGSLNDSV